eukprot:Nk52_evm9s257 gene=Nk52_evmTU9s257
MDHCFSSSVDFQTADSFTHHKEPTERPKLWCEKPQISPTELALLLQSHIDLKLRVFQLGRGDISDDERQPLLSVRSGLPHALFYYRYWAPSQGSKDLSYPACLVDLHKYLAATKSNDYAGNDKAYNDAQEELEESKVALCGKQFGEEMLKRINDSYQNYEKGKTNGSSCMSTGKLFCLCLIGAVCLISGSSRRKKFYSLRQRSIDEQNQKLIADFNGFRTQSLKFLFENSINISLTYCDTRPGTREYFIVVEPINIGSLSRLEVDLLYPGILNMTFATGKFIYFHSWFDGDGPRTNVDVDQTSVFNNLDLQLCDVEAEDIQLLSDTYPQVYPYRHIIHRYVIRRNKKRRASELSFRSSCTSLLKQVNTRRSSEVGPITIEMQQIQPSPQRRRSSLGSVLGDMGRDSANSFGEEFGGSAGEKVGEAIGGVLKGVLGG